jgi:hypothetical protein
MPVVKVNPYKISMSQRVKGNPFKNTQNLYVAKSKRRDIISYTEEKSTERHIFFVIFVNVSSFL